jgi:hypothetical protein
VKDRPLWFAKIVHSVLLIEKVDWWKKMTHAVDIAKKLKKFMDDNRFSPSDIYRGMIPLINPEKGNGNGRGEGRKRYHEADRGLHPETSMECTT